MLAISMYFPLLRSKQVRFRLPSEVLGRLSWGDSDARSLRTMALSSRSLQHLHSLSTRGRSGEGQWGLRLVRLAQAAKKKRTRNAKGPNGKKKKGPQNSPTRNMQRWNNQRTQSIDGSSSLGLACPTKKHNPLPNLNPLWRLHRD